MNIDHAKAIPVAEILKRLDHHPRKSSSGKLLYLSPIRKEKTPSFWVYTKANRWHDYGIGQGGDTVDLICAFLKYTKEDHTIPDALRWLNNIMGRRYEFQPVCCHEPENDKESGLMLRKATLVQHRGLVHYLQKRGIPFDIAQKHIAQVHVKSKRTGKSFYALGFDNEEGGYELRNPFFKGSLGPKTISLVRSSQPAPDSVHLFEGFIDYLSAIARLKGHQFKGDAIILNSISCLRQVAPYIQGYSYRTAYSWFDNDPAGQRATKAFHEFVQTQPDLLHVPMNQVYAPHKDVNAWHMQQLGLEP
jgi:hypothetical protein